MKAGKIAMFLTGLLGLLMVLRGGKGQGTFEKIRTFLQ
jgi:hypothetical protein